MAKRLEDFPRFVVTAVRRGTTCAEGYTSFEIEGKFDAALENRLEQITEDTVSWFYLLFSERGCLCVSLKSFDKPTRTAILTCQEREEPNVLGLGLAYLSPYWQPFNIWMVTDRNWNWHRQQFEGTDAIAEDYEAKEMSIVAGREVRVWTKLQPSGVSTGQSRHYPAIDQTLPVRPGTQLIRGAWGHEHCTLCHEHIDTGMFGYVDPECHWICENCYERYVACQDLAFVDEL